MGNTGIAFIPKISISNPVNKESRETQLKLNNSNGNFRYKLKSVVFKKIINQTKHFGRLRIGATFFPKFLESWKRSVCPVSSIDVAYFCFVLFAIFILHSRESELYRYILDGTSALA